MGKRTLVPHVEAEGQQHDGDGGITRQQGDHVAAGQQPPEPGSEDYGPGVGVLYSRLNASSNSTTVAASATVATRGSRPAAGPAPRVCRSRSADRVLFRGPC